MKLADVWIYLPALEERKHPKTDYKARKLKRKLEQSEIYGQKLAFCWLNSWGKFRSNIVYNSDMSTNRAVSLAHELGSADMVQDVALYLRNLIAEAL